MVQTHLQNNIRALLVDERTAAKLLGGLSTRTLFTLRRDAGLPHCHVGSRIFYRPADLQSWIESRIAAAGMFDVLRVRATAIIRQGRGLHRIEVGGSIECRRSGRKGWRKLRRVSVPPWPRTLPTYAIFRLIQVVRFVGLFFEAIKFLAWIPAIIRKLKAR